MDIFLFADLMTSWNSSERMLTFNEGNCFDFMDSCFLFTFLFLFCIRKQAAMDFRENTWTFERKITKVVLAEVK